MALSPPPSSRAIAVAILLDLVAFGVTAAGVVSRQPLVILATSTVTALLIIAGVTVLRRSSRARGARPDPR